MEQLFEFILNHPFLISAFIIVSTILIINFWSNRGKYNIDPIHAIQIINREQALVVDIRPIADFNKGHIVNAVNLPINSLKNQLHTLEKNKNKPILITCRSGNQGQIAQRELVKAGFKNVYNLQGGIFAWIDANLPISKKR